MNRTVDFLKREAVLVISLILAVASTIYVQPGKEILGCIDYNVLVLLFCLMLAVAGLKKCNVFSLISVKVLSRGSGARTLALILCALTFFIAMLLTNDVALIALVPFTLMLLKSRPTALIITIVLQTVCANIGSMVTPFGNPQNLYIYANMSISPAFFFSHTAPIALAGFATAAILSLFIKNEPVKLDMSMDIKLKNPSFIWIYAALFVLCILCVFKALSFTVVFTSALLAIFILDASLFAKVDYCLLLTFVCFFVFTENITQIPMISGFIADMTARNELLTAVASSQVISNVPAAILLSKYSQNTSALLLGVNIGGLGTLIASLASLISFKLYSVCENARPFKYLLIFTIVNVLTLAVLYLLSIQMI